MKLSSSQWNIRTACELDVEKIVILVESVYRGSSSKQGWTTEADLLDGQRTDFAMIQEMMATPESFFYVIDSPNQQILAASVFFQKTESGGYLGMLAVSTEFQNQKLGKILIHFCEQKVREWGLAKIKITVIDRRTELISWYERFGFVKTGHFEKFPDDPRYGLPKVKDLKMLELEKIVTSGDSVMF